MPIIPAATPVGELRYEWLDPTGILRDLSWSTSPNLFVSRGTKGLGLSKVELSMDKLPGTPGSLLRHIKTSPREIELPIHISSNSITGLMNAINDLRNWFFTGDENLKTPGYLRVTDTNGVVKQIACYYTEGLEGDMDVGGLDNAPIVIKLTAPDSFFTDIEETIIIYEEPALDYFHGAAPVQIIMNNGDIDAYPIWEIIGPGRDITITNLTTGKFFSLTASGGITLDIGESLIVDTRLGSARPGLQVYDDTGQNFFYKLTNTSDLWWLVPGENRFKVEMLDMNVADSEVHLSYLPSYRAVLR